MAMTDNSDKENTELSTRFKPGNQFWKQRSKHGRDKIFSSKESLWDACCEYFDHVEDNPILLAENFSFQGNVTMAPLPKMRIMTIDGLCRFLHVGRNTWDDYKKKYADFSEVIEMVEKIIYEQKLAGAAAGAFNPSIIARDLGLADKQDITSAGKAIKTQWHIHPRSTNGKHPQS